MSWLGIARLSLFWFYLMSFFNEAAALSPGGSLHADSAPPIHGNFLMLAAGDVSVPGFQVSDSKQSGGAEREFKTSASDPHAAESMGSVAPALDTTTPGHAPSLIQRLEGREGDLTVWIAIAVTFFLAGWIGGVIYARRRERSRRGKLRF